MNDLLIDTNVLIYAIDEDSLYFSQSQRIICHPNVSLYTTSKNISEFLAVMTRGTENALSIYDALNAVGDFDNFLNILYPTKDTYRYLMRLLRKYNPVGLKIHDFEIASIGIANGIDQIVTFNQKDFNQIEELYLYPL